MNHAWGIFLYRRTDYQIYDVSAESLFLQDSAMYLASEGQPIVVIARLSINY